MPAKPSTNQATRSAAKQLAKSLQTLPDSFVMCRDVRHAWAVDEDFHVEPGQSVGKKVTHVRRVLGCMRCPTRRVEHYIAGRYGLDKTSQYYEYPENYQLPGVPRGVKPSTIIQQEQYRRALERATNVEKGARSTAER